MLLPKWSSLCSGKSAWTLFSEWKESTLYHSHTQLQVRDMRYEKTFICNICDGPGTQVHPLWGSSALREPRLSLSPPPPPPPPNTARHHLDTRKTKGEHLSGLCPLPSYQAALLLSVSAACHAAVVFLLWTQFPRLLPVTALIIRRSLMKNMIPSWSLSEWPCARLIAAHHRNV